MTANNNFGTAYFQITDTTDDAAKAKIFSAVVRHMSAHDMMPNFMLYPAYNSIAMGVEVSELVTNSQRPERLIIAVNYAPPDKKEGTKDNIRNDFFFAVLDDSTTVCGTSNGFEFSYIKPRIKEFYRLTNTNHLLSQFRSLEVLPEHAVLFSIPEERERLKREKKLKRVENIDDIIPFVPDVSHVMEVDNFGNVKICLSENDKKLLEGRLLNFETGGMSREARAKRRSSIYFAFGDAALEVGENNIRFGRFSKALAARTFFAVPMGENVLAARSSSVFVDGRDVPVIASVRSRPGATRPEYFKYKDKDGNDCEKTPQVGAPVFLYWKNPKKMPPGALRLSLGN